MLFSSIWKHNFAVKRAVPCLAQGKLIRWIFVLELKFGLDLEGKAVNRMFYWTIWTMLHVSSSSHHPCFVYSWTPVMARNNFEYVFVYFEKLIALHQGRFVWLYFCRCIYSRVFSLGFMMWPLFFDFIICPGKNNLVYHCIHSIKPC